MDKPETSTRKIIARLLSEGWRNARGSKHDKYEHEDFSYPIIVPRHTKLSPGVARKIAKDAGWI